MIKKSETIVMPIRYDIYADLLLNHLGRTRAIKARHLAERWKLSLRDINEAIRLMRKEGRLIGSAKEPPFGYYIPASTKERDEYLNAFKGELFDMLRTYNAQKRARRDFIEKQKQPSLFRANLSGQMELAGVH